MKQNGFNEPLSSSSHRQYAAIFRGMDDATSTPIMTEFAPYASLAGGGLLGVAASLLLLGNGRLAGVSGIAGNILLGKPGDRAWRAAFVLGLVVAGFLASMLSSGALGDSPRSTAVIAAAGLMVGIGTRLGSGCTSGHGVCGVSRLSPRSLIATLTFMASGIMTVALVRWLGGGS